MPTVQQSLTNYCRKMLRPLILGSLAVACVPFPEKYYLGNGGNPLFAAIAPLLLLIASGLVCVSWCVLILLMWPIGKIGRLVFGRLVCNYRGNLIKTAK